jgi:hypothetical protein
VENNIGLNTPGIFLNVLPIISKIVIRAKENSTLTYGMSLRHYIKLYHDDITARSPIHNWNSRYDFSSCNHDNICKQWAAVGIARYNYFYNIVGCTISNYDMMTRKIISDVGSFTEKSQVPERKSDTIYFDIDMVDSYENLVRNDLREDDFPSTITDHDGNTTYIDILCVFCAFEKKIAKRSILTYIKKQEEHMEEKLDVASFLSISYKLSCLLYPGKNFFMNDSDCQKLDNIL